jgi:catechol 2,3-dioxygenase-like lactoylglutathione lyase family enzyme
VRLAHLNITVSDAGRSREFYGRWFGFERVLAEYPDATTFLVDRAGFELGLHVGTSRAGSDWHFGFVAQDAREVRELRDRMRAAGVLIREDEDGLEYCGFKCSDPDGYIIEVYFEPRAERESI